MKCCPVPYQIKDPVDVPETSLWLYTLWRYIFCFTLRPYFYLRFSHVMFQYSRWVCHKYLWKTTLILREHVGRMVNLHCLPSYPIILLSMSEWLFLTSCADLCFPDTAWSKKSLTHTWVRRSGESERKPLLWRMVHIHLQYVICTLSPVSAVYRTSFSNVLFDILTNHRYIPICQISLKQIVSAWITLTHFLSYTGKRSWYLV